MATLSVNTELTIVDDFESTPDLWMIGAVDVGNPAVDTTVFRQGTQSAGCNVGFHPAWVGGMGVKITSLDISTSEDTLWVWVLLIPSLLSVLETQQNAGLRLRLYSGTLVDDGDDLVTDAGNTWVEYNIGGIDTLSLGWNRVVVTPSEIVASSYNGTIDFTDITLVGFIYTLASQYYGGSARALFMDCIHTGKGINFSGGTSGDEITPEIVAAYTESVSNAYGILEYDRGVWRVNGEINAGVAGATTYFQAADQLLLFQDQSYYEMISGTGSLLGGGLHGIKGTAGIDTNIDITSSVLRIGGISQFELDFNDPSINLNMTGNNVSGASAVTFAAGQYITGVFNACGQIILNSSTFEDVGVCNYSGTDGAILWPVSSNISNLTFNDNTRAIEHDVAATVNYDNLSFSNNTYNIHNSSAGTVDIYMLNGGNADIGSVINTGGGIINIYNLRTKSFTGLPENTEVRIRLGSYTLDHVQNVTGGTHEYEYDPDDKIAIAQFTLPGYMFEPISITLDDVNQVFPVTVKPDPSYTI